MTDHGFISVKGNTWCDICGEGADRHEPEGTFACSICGSESRHSHTSIEIAEHYVKEKTEAYAAHCGSSGPGVGAAAIGTVKLLEQENKQLRADVAKLVEALAEAIENIEEVNVVLAELSLRYGGIIGRIPDTETTYGEYAIILELSILPKYRAALAPWRKK